MRRYIDLWRSQLRSALYINVLLTYLLTYILPVHFRCFAAFRNHMRLKVDFGQKIEAKFRIFFTPVTSRGGWANVSVEFLVSQPRTQFLIYFWCGNAARAANLNTFSLLFFLGMDSCVPLNSQSWGRTLNLGRRLDIIGAPNAGFRSKINVASFRNCSAL